jgi:hypothetical protein
MTAKHAMVNYAQSLRTENVLFVLEQTSLKYFLSFLLMKTKTSRQCMPYVLRVVFAGQYKQLLPFSQKHELET